MNLFVFTNGRTHVRPGWNDAHVWTLFGSALIDVHAPSPYDDAVLTARVLFGTVMVILPPGLQVTMDGFSLFSRRSVTLQSVANGARIRLTLSSVFGSITVIEHPGLEAGLVGQESIGATSVMPMSMLHARPKSHAD